MLFSSHRKSWWQHVCLCICKADTVIVSPPRKYFPRSHHQWPPVMLVKLARIISLVLRFFGILPKVWLLRWHSPRTLLLGDGFDRVLYFSGNRRRHQIDMFDLLGQRFLCHADSIYFIPWWCFLLDTTAACLIIASRRCSTASMEKTKGRGAGKLQSLFPRSWLMIVARDCAFQSGKYKDWFPRRRSCSKHQAACDRIFLPVKINVSLTYLNVGWERQSLATTLDREAIEAIH